MYKFFEELETLSDNGIYKKNEYLFFSFLETTYRAILFFLIIGSPLFLLFINFDENLRYIRLVKKTKATN